MLYFFSPAVKRNIPLKPKKLHQQPHQPQRPIEIQPTPTPTPTPNSATINSLTKKRASKKSQTCVWPEDAQDAVRLTTQLDFDNSEFIDLATANTLMDDAEVNNEVNDLSSKTYPEHGHIYVYRANVDQQFQVQQLDGIYWVSQCYWPKPTEEFKCTRIWSVIVNGERKFKTSDFKKVIMCNKKRGLTLVQYIGNRNVAQPNPNLTFGSHTPPAPHTESPKMKAAFRYELAQKREQKIKQKELVENFAKSMSTYEDPSVEAESGSHVKKLFTDNGNHCNYMVIRLG